MSNRSLVLDLSATCDMAQELSSSFRPHVSIMKGPCIDKHWNILDMGLLCQSRVANWSKGATGEK
jgi:hypothetical protein